jgi:hypothetical protein
METTLMTEPGVPEDVRPEKESQRTVDLEELAQMSLESLLYYVLVGEGRVKNAPVEG